MTFKLCCDFCECGIVGMKGIASFESLLRSHVHKRCYFMWCQCRMRGWYNTEWNPPPLSSLHTPVYTHVHTHMCTFIYPLRFHP